jgi:DNA-binding MarR family transcriptional regulator
MAAGSPVSPESSACPPEEARTLHALLALDRAYPRLWRMLEEQIAADVPLSRNEIRLLQEIPLDGGAPVGELARDLDIDPGQLSRLLSRLARRRLVSRERSDTDARKRRIMVSARGRLALAAIDRAAVRIAERVLGTLSAADRRRLSEAAVTISGALAAPREGSGSV